MNNLNMNNKVNSVFLFCAVFCFVWSSQDKVRVQIKPQSVLELRQQAEICSKETGVPADHLKKIIDKTLPNDKPNKEFFMCVASNKGYAEKDGHFIVDKMLTFSAVNGTQEEYANSLKECNKIEKGDGLETLTAIADCIHDSYEFVILAPQ